MSVPDVMCLLLVMCYIGKLIYTAPNFDEDEDEEDDDDDEEEEEEDEAEGLGAHSKKLHCAFLSLSPHVKKRRPAQHAVVIS